MAAARTRAPADRNYRVKTDCGPAAVGETIRALSIALARCSAIIFPARDKPRFHRRAERRYARSTNYPCTRDSTIRFRSTRLSRGYFCRFTLMRARM